MHNNYDYCVVTESLCITEGVFDLKFHSSFLRNLHQSNGNIFSQRIVYEMMKYIIHVSQYNNQKTITLHRQQCPVTIPVSIANSSHEHWGKRVYESLKR